MQTQSERHSREIIEEICDLLNLMDLKLIEEHRAANPEAKRAAKQDLLSDHRIVARAKQHWR